MPSLHHRHSTTPNINANMGGGFDIEPHRVTHTCCVCHAAYTSHTHTVNPAASSVNTPRNGVTGCVPPPGTPGGVPLPQNHISRLPLLYKCAGCLQLIGPAGNNNHSRRNSNSNNINHQAYDDPSLSPGRRQQQQMKSRLTPRIAQHASPQRGSAQDANTRSTSASTAYYLSQRAGAPGGGGAINQHHYTVVAPPMTVNSLQKDATAVAWRRRGSNAVLTFAVHRLSHCSWRDIADNVRGCGWTAAALKESAASNQKPPLNLGLKVVVQCATMEGSTGVYSHTFHASRPVVKRTKRGGPPVTWDEQFDIPIASIRGNITKTPFVVSLIEVHSNRTLATAQVALTEVLAAQHQVECRWVLWSTAAVNNNNNNNNGDSVVPQFGQLVVSWDVHHAPSNNNNNEEEEDDGEYYYRDDQDNENQEKNNDNTDEEPQHQQQQDNQSAPLTLIISRGTAIKGAQIPLVLVSQGDLEAVTSGPLQFNKQTGDAEWQQELQFPEFANGVSNTDDSQPQSSQKFDRRVFFGILEKPTQLQAATTAGVSAQDEEDAALLLLQQQNIISVGMMEIKSKSGTAIIPLTAYIANNNNDRDSTQKILGELVVVWKCNDEVIFDDENDDGAEDDHAPRREDAKNKQGDKQQPEKKNNSEAVFHTTNNNNNNNNFINNPEDQVLLMTSPCSTNKNKTQADDEANKNAQPQSPTQQIPAQSLSPEFSRKSPIAIDKNNNNTNNNNQHQNPEMVANTNHVQSGYKHVDVSSSGDDEIDGEELDRNKNIDTNKTNLPINSTSSIASPNDADHTSRNILDDETVSNVTTENEKNEISEAEKKRLEQEKQQRERQEKEKASVLEQQEKKKKEEETQKQQQQKVAAAADETERQQKQQQQEAELQRQKQQEKKMNEEQKQQQQQLAVAPDETSKKPEIQRKQFEEAEKEKQEQQQKEKQEQQQAREKEEVAKKPQQQQQEQQPPKDSTEAPALRRSSISSSRPANDSINDSDKLPHTSTAPTQEQEQESTEETKGDNNYGRPELSFLVPPQKSSQAQENKDNNNKAAIITTDSAKNDNSLFADEDPPIIGRRRGQRFIADQQQKQKDAAAEKRKRDSLLQQQHDEVYNSMTNAADYEPLGVAPLGMQYVARNVNAGGRRHHQHHHHRDSSANSHQHHGSAGSLSSSPTGTQRQQQQQASQNANGSIQLLLLPVPSRQSSSSSNSNQQKQQTTKNPDDIDGDENDNDNSGENNGEIPGSNLPLDLSNIPSWWQQILLAEQQQRQRGQHNNNKNRNTLLNDAADKERGAYNMMDEELSVISDDDSSLSFDDDDDELGNNNKNYLGDDDDIYDAHGNRIPNGARRKNETEEEREARLAQRAKIYFDLMYGSSRKNNRNSINNENAKYKDGNNTNNKMPFYPSGNPKQHLHPKYYHVQQAIKSSHDDSVKMSNAAVAQQTLMLKHQRENDESLMLMMNHNTGANQMGSNRLLIANNNHHPPTTSSRAGSTRSMTPRCGANSGSGNINIATSENKVEV